MILLCLFANLSFEFQIDHLKMNKSIIFNLVLKRQFDHSPILIPPLQTIKTTLFFKDIHYSYSNSQFLKMFSHKSFYFANSNFNNLLNSVVSSEQYEPPDFNETIFYISPICDKSMVTFRRCNFFDISNQNNINRQPALYSTSQIFRVYSCVFRNCVNEGNGGAIYATNCDFLLVNDCDFISCRSSQNGGAFYCTNSALIVFRNAFQFCSASLWGGAFMYEDAVHTWDLIIQSNLFTRCQANRYKYFHASFNQIINNTCYLYFNKFRCLESEEKDYFDIIVTETNDPVNFSRFRNAYGDDNYNVHLSPTRTFSPLPTISPTPIFTPSTQFTISSIFSQSSQFTQSSPFTSSLHFTPSNSFTPSIIFSSSQPFTRSTTFTLAPTHTISASRTPFATPSKSPLNTPLATPSISPTPAFTESQSFTPAESPVASETPTLSKTPCITWPNLSLGLLILLGIILLLGIIANIYLIMLCCKPSEIFVQQVL